MRIEYHRHYSGHLGREMEFKRYGHAGKPVLFIPCQGGRFFDFENFKMLEHWAGWIDAGKCTVYSADCIDNETYANTTDHPGHRIWRHECWYNYIVEELVPTIRHLSGLDNGFDQPILVFGASMGAMHAGNLFFRRPDLFDSVFAISGLYDSDIYFPGYTDEVLYRNTPCSYIPNMPQDHPYIGLYNSRKMLFVVGQGAWEDELLASTRRLQGVLEQKGINGRFEYWGYDVNHDWPWWYKMVHTYLPWFLD